MSQTVPLHKDIPIEHTWDTEVTVDRERVGITWAQFPTYLYSNFYVYQYATGISGAHALAQNILAGKPNAVENYLGFLRAGGSEFPLNIGEQLYGQDFHLARFVFTVS